MSDGTLLLAMVHALPDAVVGVDGGGRVRAWNAAASSLFGKTEEEAYGAPIRELTGLDEKGEGSFAGSVEIVPVDAPGGAGVAHAENDVVSLLVMRPRTAEDDARDIEEDLPPRLKETLKGLCEGLAEKEIAAKLGLSQHTVHDYVKSIYRRFRVQSRAALVARVVVLQKKA
jgi:DNA-binding CsgD family transcriptional regulator